MSVVYEGTSDEKELRKQQEIDIIERCIFLEIIYRMFELNNKAGGNKELSENAKRLERYIRKQINSNGSRQANFRRRRLSRCYNAIIEYVINMKFDTRKVIFIVMQLVPWLSFHKVIDFDDEAMEILVELQNNMEKFKDKIDGFEQIETAAARKAWSFLEVLQDLGYFKFEVKIN